MNVEEITDYCLSLPNVTSDFPFDDTTMVFRVGQKIFALVSLDSHPPRINLKCDPDKAIELREQYEGVQPGYHMNKKHWNTVYCDDFNLPQKVIKELILHSFDLVFKSLTKAAREHLNANGHGSI